MQFLHNHKLKIYGKKNWRIKVIQNKYPAISLDNKDSYGKQEIVIESPIHNCMLHEQKVENISELLKAYSERTKKITTTNITSKYLYPLFS